MSPSYWRNSSGFNYATIEQKVKRSTNLGGFLMTSSTTVQIPGYVVGTWDIDAAHSTVGFSVRHMLVSKVRRYFRSFSGELVTAADPAQSTVTATLDMDSIAPRQQPTDAHHRT